MNKKNYSSLSENSGSALSSPVRLYGSPARKKHVVPYSPRSPDRYSKSLFSASYKVNNTSSPSVRIKSFHFSPKKNRTVSNAEFTSMLENPPQSFKDSFLGQALFDLSIGLRSLNNVLNLILNFRLNAPLKYYSYASLISLINASTLCPPDVVLQLLSIGKVMITKHNYAKPQYLRALIKVTKYLISKNFYYVSYGKSSQDKPKRKLERLLKIFTEFLDIPPIGPEGSYVTSKIEDIMSKNQSFNDEKLEKEIQRRKRNRELREKELKNNNGEYDENDSEYEKTEITGSFTFESDFEDLIQSDKIINSDVDSDKENKNIIQNFPAEKDKENESKFKSNEKVDYDFNSINNIAKEEEYKLNNKDKNSIKENNDDNILDKENNKEDNNIMKEIENVLDSKDGKNSIKENNNDDIVNKENNDIDESNNDNFKDKNIMKTDDTLKSKDDTNVKENDANELLENNSENDNDKDLQDNENKENEIDDILSVKSNENQNLSDKEKENDDELPISQSDDKSKKDENDLTEDDENIFLLEDGNENSTDDNLILENSSENILTENDDDLILERDENSQSTKENQKDTKSQKEKYIDTKIQTDELEFYQNEKSQTENDSSATDDNFLVSNIKNNFEESDRMSSKSWKSSLTESVQFSIDIEPETKNRNGEENIPLRQIEDSDPNMHSIERFIRSTDTLYERREKGKSRLENLSQEQREKIDALSQLFNNWKTAYASSRVVWNTMKADSTFDVNILLYQIPVSYGDFLVEALTTFAEQEGIIIQKIESPL